MSTLTLKTTGVSLYANLLLSPAINSLVTKTAKSSIKIRPVDPKSIILFSLFLILLLLSNVTSAYQPSSEDSHNHDRKADVKTSEKEKINIKEADDEHDKGITLTAEKMSLANIKVTTLIPKVFAKSIYAPGEIKANGYTSYIVSPRTESVVVSRHATLGEHVEKGQPLVTLFSESMAEAQANYRVAYSEWQRVKRLAKGTISESTSLKNETEYISALGRLTAFGLTKQAIKNVVKNNSSNLGEYTLVAKIAGAVLSDDFSQGQRVAAGDKIMILANEENLWVEARVSPNKPLNLPVGTIARIEFGGQAH